jgi:uncharacterized protein involved in exopolysaccharide biosynthesis
LNWLFRRAGERTLSNSEEQHQDIAGDAPESIQISIVDLLKELWQRRRFLAAITGIGMILAIGYALLIPRQYESTARLMPPDQQSLSNISVLNALSGVGPTASLGGGLMSAKTSAGTFIGIMHSQTAQNNIINRLDLLHAYHCKLYITARSILTKRTIIDEDQRSGIISISVMDSNPARARDTANAYVEELDRLINALSSSSARRERIFLEERLKSIKSDLDASSIALSEFSSRNATMNPQSQGQALFESATRLQGELITAQSELSGLKALYADDNVRVREARARIDELQSQLRKMGNIGGKEDDSNQKADQPYPSIRELPILGVTYSDLYRQLAMQEEIYETLTKQYELAKVEEAKEIPAIKVLDEPELPEINSLPHRKIIVVLGSLLSAFVGIAWIIAGKYWEIIDITHPAKAFGMDVLRSIRGQNSVTPN